MEIDDYSLILSVWGAALSTILAVLTFIRFKRDSSTMLLTFGVSTAPFDKVRIDICNKGRKPVTLKAIALGIGASKNHQTELVKITYSAPTKLSESDMHFEKVSRLELQNAIKTKNIKQKEFQLLWINVQSSTGKKFSHPVYIDPAIIKGEFYKKAEQFIACDLFLGFQKMASKAYPIGINK
jgi:hypothetical protein